MADLIIRPLVDGEQPSFESLIDPARSGFDRFTDRYRDRIAGGEYRPEWTWTASRHGQIVAGAAWWGSPDADTPTVLDWFDFSDFDAAVCLLQTAPFRTDHSMRLPLGRHGDPALARDVRRRIDAAHAAGLTPLVERNRYRWTPECGIGESPGRLRFRPEPDDITILELFRRIHQGTLDAHARRAIAVSGLDGAAREDLDILLSMSGPRHWWRTAHTPDGELVGLAVPTRTLHDPIIGYLGVVPEQRGHGYCYDLLVETTRLLVAEGADRIIADTDVTNVPMTAAFARAGYPVVQQRLDFVC